MKVFIILTIFLLTTTALLRGTDKKVGDTVLVECNGVKEELTIDAIINAKLFNSGMVSFVNHETMRDLFNVPSSNQITFLTDLDLDTFVPKPLIQVTHSAKAAKYGTGIIRLVDGQIVEHVDVCDEDIVTVTA